MERFTIQRKLILEATKEIGHATIKDIESFILNKGYNISLATIYRNLDLLIKDNLLHRVTLNLKGEYYELASLATHNHFICTNCGNIIDIYENNKHEEYLDELGNLRKSTITTYYGICSNCLKKQ